MKKENLERVEESAAPKEKTMNIKQDADQFFDKFRDIILNGEFGREDAVNALIAWKYDNQYAVERAKVIERLQEMNRMGRQKDDPDMANQAQALINEAKL